MTDHIPLDVSMDLSQAYGPLSMRQSAHEDIFSVKPIENAGVDNGKASNASSNSPVTLQSLKVFIEAWIMLLHVRFEDHFHDSGLIVVVFYLEHPHNVFSTSNHHIYHV